MKTAFTWGRWHPCTCYTAFLPIKCAHRHTPVHILLLTIFYKTLLFECRLEITASFLCCYEGAPKKHNLFIKELYTYSYMFKLQSPSKYSAFDTIHLPRHFFHCSEQFLNSWILMLFSVSVGFCFTSSTLAKHFPLKTFFIQGNKKFAQGKIG